METNGGSSVCLFFAQIFIFENNIFYRSTVDNRAIRLVSTGKEGVVFNGLADWLYEGKTSANTQQSPQGFSHVADRRLKGRVGISVPFRIQNTEEALNK